MAARQSGLVPAAFISFILLAALPARAADGLVGHAAVGVEEQGDEVGAEARLRQRAES